MIWNFDQAPNVACIVSPSVMDGAPVLVATHYEDDHSWAFLDGKASKEDEAIVVAMGAVVAVHPDLSGIADLEPGWTATRATPGHPWIRHLNV